MPAQAKERHPYKKGEELNAIAKKYGLKDGTAIWKAPDNKALVAKRVKPEQLQPGDILVIPPSAARVENAKKFQTFCTNELPRCEKLLAICTHAEQLLEQTTTQQVKDIIGAKKELTKSVDKAHTAQFVLGILSSLTQMGVKAFKAVKLSKAEADKVGLEMAKDLGGMTADPLIGEGLQAVGKGRNSTNGVALVLGTVADSYNKMNDPAWWSQTAVAISHGEAWSDAAAKNVGEDFDTALKTVAAEYKGWKAKIDARRKDITTHVSEVQKQKKYIDDWLKSAS